MEIRHVSVAALAIAALAFPAPAHASAPVIGWQDEAAITSAERAPAAIAVARSIHARSMRLIVRWDKVEPGKGAWDWRPVDASVQRGRSAGFAVQLVLGGVASPPPWAGSSWARIRDGEFRAFVAAAARRYGAQVGVWSILNEADITGYPARRYAALYTASRRSIRAASPGARVLWGEFSAVSPISYTRAATRGRRVVADGYAIHSYPGAIGRYTQGDITRLGAVKRSLRPAFARALPLYITEYGCAANRYSEADCVAQWQQGLRVAARLRVRQLVAYQMLAVSAGTWDTGLQKLDGQPRAQLGYLAAR